MKTVSNLPVKLASRRMFLSSAGKATLSASAVAMLIGCESMAKSNMSADQDAEQDVSILNVALTLEHEAISAYQLGAESDLLQSEVLPVAVLFQSHHKEHRDALIATIQQLGGRPVEEKSLAEYAEELQANTLQNQVDVLTLAARLERGAANAYLGVIPAFVDADLGQVCGRLAADETMHWTVLTNALGQSVPEKAFSFGA